MLEINKDNYYTMEDLTEGLGWTEASIYKYCKDGLAFHKPGKVRCFKGEDINTFLAKHRFYEKSAS